jgi:Uncharacterised protein family (UPF0236)
VGCAEVIALDQVRARKHWPPLRQRLHERFDQWRDQLESALPEGAPTFGQGSETVWTLRQQLTSGVAETIVQHTHQEEQHRPHRPCPTCARRLTARGPVHRCVETLVGTIELERPSFYCVGCREGPSPLDEVWDVRAGRRQRDVQQAAVDLATEVPYETASTLLSRLSGMTLRRERMHTITQQVAAGLSVVEVAPAREEIDRRVRQGAAGRFRRPVLVLGIAGAYVPSRPERARGRRPGPARHRARRARWRHEWREAKGVRFSLLAGERIVHVLRWHQVPTEEERGEALQQGKDAGVIPEETVRLCVIGEGAEWIGKHVQALVPHAWQVLDYYHCAAYLHKVAKAQYGDPLQAQEWAEATLTRLSLGKVGQVLGGLRRMPPTSEEALKAIDHCWVSLTDHRSRTHYQTLRRGGYPLGSGGMESANQFICHVRLKRSGAWWYEDSSNQMLALRCAKYNGTFVQVFTRYHHQKAGS